MALLPNSTPGNDIEYWAVGVNKVRRFLDVQPPDEEDEDDEEAAREEAAEGEPAASEARNAPTGGGGGGGSGGGGGDGGGESATSFLSPLGPKFEKYAAAFDEAGAESLENLADMTVQEFVDDFGMTKCVQGGDNINATVHTLGGRRERCPSSHSPHPVPTLRIALHFPNPHERP